jgi:hypothetical protein
VAQPAPAPTPAPPAELSFKAKTYTNDKYGFSIQYPEDWVPRPDLMSAPACQAVFGVASYVPGVTVYGFDTPYPETKEGIVQSFRDLGSQAPKLLSIIKEGTLPDGTKAYTYKLYYIYSSDYEVTAYVLDAFNKEGKQVRVNVWTIDAFAPYDEKLASEIAHTLRFTSAE